MSDDIMVCAVCSRVLDRFEPEDGGVEFLHTMQDRAREDHPAVPVPESQIQTIGRCDFCNTDYPVWVIPVLSFEMPGLPGRFSDGDWAACDTCKALIAKNHWDTLVRRATERTDTSIIPAEIIRARLVTMYNRLRRNITGDPYPLERTS
jgi:hypothetical protein